MERIPILLTKNDEKYILSGSTSKYFVLDLSKVGEHTILEVPNNSDIDLLLLNNSKDIDIVFNVLDNAKVHLSLLADNPTNSIKISANIASNVTFSAYFADFIEGQCKGLIDVNLNGQYSTCNWHLASLSEKKDNKEFDVSIYHKAPNTFAQLDNYGVIRDDAKLTFSGVCHILHGSSGSKAHQNAKIMVFDELSNGIAKPVLKIDENDIEASHAAVVGKINDEHIFYLTSRGLSIDEAKRLITLGYLKPILHGFSDEEIKDRIEKIIEGKM